MKKTILIIASILFITSTVFPQSKMDLDNLIDRGGLLYAPNKEKPFSGSVFNLYDNGQKKLNGRYRNGIKNGKWTWWNIDGGVDSTGSYKKGLMKGQWKFYFSNGNLNGKGQYRDGNGTDLGNTGIPRHGRHGKWTFWYENGKKEVEGTYKNGKQDGKWTSWHKNEQKSSESYWKEGKHFNTNKEWFSNGNKEWEFNFNEDGTRDSTKLTTRWYESGQKRYEGYVKTLNDATHVWNGLHTAWYENGQKKREGTYENGESIDIKEFDEDGKLIAYTYESAELFREQDNFKKALFILYQLVENNSEISPKAQYLIGDILMNDLLDFEQAISAYKMVIEKFPNSLQAPEAQFMIAYIYANVLDDSENARVEYNLFLEKYADHGLTPSVKFELDFLGKDINDIPQLKHITE